MKVRSSPPVGPYSPKQRSSEQGIALLMVVFMIALATALLVSLSDSTYVAMRLNGATERRVKAEYILKSAVNLAKVLIKSDATPYDDPTQDAWMQFADGADVPGEMLGLNESNVRISLQISSEAGKIPIQKLVKSGDQVDKAWGLILKQLFIVLGFDDDTKEVDQTGYFAGRHFKSDELVSNLIDYMDANLDGYAGTDFPPGIESSLPQDAPFRNEKIDSISSELSSIPGFTPNRVQRLIPFLTTANPPKVNINAAPKEVIQALAPDLSAADAQKVVDFRNPANGGPFTINRIQELDQLVGQNGQSLGRNTDITGSWFEVIVKVDYGTSYYMARALLHSGGNGRLPKEQTFDLY